MRIWRCNVREIVEDLADEALQRKAWVGEGSAALVPGELFNRFFDDTGFERFLEDPENGLDADQRAAARKLLVAMRVASDRTPKFVEPHDLIGQEFWSDCVNSAGELVRLRPPA